MLGGLRVVRRISYKESEQHFRIVEVKQRTVMKALRGAASSNYNHSNNGTTILSLDSLFTLRRPATFVRQLRCGVMFSVSSRLIDRISTV